MQNEPVAKEMEFNDFEIVPGLAGIEDDELSVAFVRVKGNDLVSVTYHLNLKLNPSVFVLVYLREE